MARKKHRINKRCLTTIVKGSKNIDKLFNDLNSQDLSELSNHEMALNSYEIGYHRGAIGVFKKLYKGIPDYEKIISRLEIMRDKLYKEAQRRDGE